MERTLKVVPVGAVVKHLDYDFAGEVVANDGGWNGEQVVIRITDGEHPFSKTDKTYTASTYNVEVIAKPVTAEDVVAELDSLFEAIILQALSTEEDTEVEVDTNGEVTVTMADGTKLNFEYYADFIDFIKITGAIKL